MRKTDFTNFSKRLLVTGGHLTPAIAVIEELKEIGNWQIVVLIRRSGKTLDRIPPHVRELVRLGVKVAFLQTGKFSRHLGLRGIIDTLNTIVGVVTAYVKIKKLRPDVILSFGGYLALPAAVSGKLLGIPIVTHEQTTTKGLATAFIEPLADAIAVSWKETSGHFRRKVRLTGNPLRKAIIMGRGSPITIKKGSQPLLWVTGGNQGAHAINRVVEQSLTRLLTRYSLVHQCGSAMGGDDYHQLLLRRSQLPNRLKDGYVVRPWFTVEEIAWLLKRADLVISRAGANTVAEIAFTGAIALFVPLPAARHAEQLKNALLLKKAGSAEILPQERLNPASLLTTIDRMLKHAARYRRAAIKARAMIPPDAAAKLAQIIEETYEKNKNW